MTALYIIIGYVCGCILTAVPVSLKYSGKTCFEMGSGNPGMANVMTELGFKPGILVLIGDLAKTVFACCLCRFVLAPAVAGTLTSGVEAWMGTALGAAGAFAAAAGGLGAILGHNFPFWHKFKGGKGVSCTCAALFCIHPLWAIAAMLIGMVVVFATKYLSVGAPFIPGAFIPVTYVLYGKAMMIIAILMTAFMCLAHGMDLIRVVQGTEKRVDVLAKIREKTGKKKEIEDVR